LEQTSLLIAARQVEDKAPSNPEPRLFATSSSIPEEQGKGNERNINNKSSKKKETKENIYS
jgi:hypothetical protein